jgi:hypothetical protein
VEKEKFVEISKVKESNRGERVVSLLFKPCIGTNAKKPYFRLKDQIEAYSTFKKDTTKLVKTILVR